MKDQINRIGKTENKYPKLLLEVIKTLDNSIFDSDVKDTEQNYLEFIYEKIG
jgi:hypothetical protein